MEAQQAAQGLVQGRDIPPHDALPAVECRAKPGSVQVAGEQSEEALAWAREHPVDLVLADYKMPRMDGEQLFQAIRSSGAETQVIILSGHGDIPQAVEFIKAGAFDSTGAKRAQLMAVLDHAIEDGAAAQREREMGQTSIFGEELSGDDVPTAPPLPPTTRKGISRSAARVALIEETAAIRSTCASHRTDSPSCSRAAPSAVPISASRCDRMWAAR